MLGSVQTQRISLSFMYDSNDFLYIQNHSTRHSWYQKLCLAVPIHRHGEKRLCKMTKSRKYRKGGVRGRGKPTWGAGMLSLLE